MTKNEYERRKLESYKVAQLHATEEGHETTYPITIITDLKAELQAMKLEIEALKSLHEETLNEIKAIVKKIAEEAL